MFVLKGPVVPSEKMCGVCVCESLGKDIRTFFCVLFFFRTTVELRGHTIVGIP